MRWVRGPALTTGAVLGVLCLLVAVSGPLLGIRPLVVLSGSMGPAMPAGSLLVVRTVPAATVGTGDVVSVETSGGSRVTHRVVELQRLGDGTSSLVLRGDANPTSDPEPYVVGEVDEVVATVPVLGRVVHFLGTTPGIVVLVVCLLGLLVLGRGGGGGASGRRRRARHPRARRRRTVSATGAVVGLGALVATALPTLALFTDAAAVSSGNVVSGVATSPTAAATPCSASNPFLGTNSVTLRWNGVAPGATSVPVANHEYRLTLSSGGSTSTTTQTHSGGSGALQSVTYIASTLGSLLSLNLGSLLFSQDFTLVVRSRIVGTSWTSASASTFTFSVSSGLTGNQFSCL